MHSNRADTIERTASPHLRSTRSDLPFARFPDFTPLLREHRHAIEQHTMRFPPYSDFAFTSLWCWNVHNVVEASVLNRNLVVRLTDHLTDVHFLSFIGDNEVEATLDAIFERIRSSDDLLDGLKLIPAHNLANSESLDRYEITEDRDNHDYVYSVEEQSSLAGNRFQTQRRLAKRFKSLYSPQIALLDLADSQIWAQIEKVCEAWAKRQSSRGNAVTNDVSALFRLRELVHMPNLIGLGVFVNSELAGYCLLETHTSGFVSGRFEHADVSYSGICACLRNECAKFLNERGFTFLNHEQDLGLSNLRSAKLAYRPVAYLKKLMIRQK